MPSVHFQDDDPPSVQLQSDPAPSWLQYFDHLKYLTVVPKESE